eukprot:4878386-Lingulodinium_polyedra.AAC.1
MQLPLKPTPKADTMNLNTFEIGNSNVRASNLKLQHVRIRCLGRCLGAAAALWGCCLGAAWKLLGSWLGAA